MAHVHLGGVVDTTTTTGTGALTVSGSAPTGHQTFSAVCSTSDTFYYYVRSQSEAEWEGGLGTYSGTNQITRTTVLASSNSNAAVDFSAGTKDVFIDHPAERDLPRLSGALVDDEIITANGTAGQVQSSGVAMPASSGSVLVDDVANQGPITGGATFTAKALTAGSQTLNCGLGPLQKITNSGAFTLTAPANDGSCVLLVTNDGSAGAITFSGFQVGSNVGDDLTTTDGHDFMIYITRINSLSTYSIQAMQ